MSGRAPSPFRITAAVSEAMQLLAQLPDDDERLKHDSLEGETRFFAVMDDLAEAALADAKLVELARERIKRIEARAERHRDIIRRMLEIAEMAKAQRPLYSASVSYRSKPIVTDQSLLPEAFIRRSPDMHLIAKALKDSNRIDGVELSNPSPVLTLRSS